jgi:hypothetical protein
VVGSKRELVARPRDRSGNFVGGRFTGAPYLDRKEGDASNAGSWYCRAGKPHAEQVSVNSIRDQALILRQNNTKKDARAPMPRQLC